MADPVVLRLAGPSRALLRRLPPPGQAWAGYQIHRLQHGLEPAGATVKRMWGGPARRATKRLERVTYGLFYLPPRGPAGELLVLRTYACFCDSRLDHPCIGTREEEDEVGPDPQDEVFADVWAAVADDPSAASDLRRRADMMLRLSRLAAAAPVPDRELARRWGISGRALNSLRGGRLDRFPLARLEAILARAA